MKGFALENFIEKQLTDESDGYARSRIVLETEQSALRSLAAVVMIFTQYGFFVVAGLLVAWGDLALGAFIAQIMLLSRFVAPLNQMIEFRNALTQSKAAWDRIHEVLTKHPKDSALPMRSPCCQTPPIPNRA